MVKADARKVTLEQLWANSAFSPNDQQREAILHVDGPLYLPAGPGSGKTRVLLWRTLNLCVFNGVKPEEVYLSTFTEKAAFQLKEGLRALLGRVTDINGTPYDLSQMYIGTVHALCQRLIADRRFYPDRARGRAPQLLDDLAQYFFVYKQRIWRELTEIGAFAGDANGEINALFGDGSRSRHKAVTNCISLFNRLSEERIDPEVAASRITDPVFLALLQMYRRYAALLDSAKPPDTDFSLLQQKALAVLEQHEGTTPFAHVIIDEYQDTNTIQEQIFFHLAARTHNICVVGDDDQALYRFRGATVENFVEFPDRCEQMLGVRPRPIPLTTNYRSRHQIVTFTTAFIQQCDWRRADDPTRSYRVADKDIQPASADEGVSVIETTPGKPVDAIDEIARLVSVLVESGKVADPNQVAILFPSMKYQGKMNENVRRMKTAFEAIGLKVYAPRAGRFLEVDEATDLFGVYLHIFGMLPHADIRGYDYRDYYAWLQVAYERGRELLAADAALAQFVADRREELSASVLDYQAMRAVVERKGWDPKDAYVVARMKRALYDAPGLSQRGRRALSSVYFEKIVLARAQEGHPFTLEYILRRCTSIDWSVVDLFYQLCGFEHFKAMLDLAEHGEDEGPVCNLGLLTQHLARFMDEYTPIITADYLVDGKFQRVFFGSYLFALFRRGEAEYEDADDPFPRGRVPFLTVHQAKGLEFPVVILASLRKDHRNPPRMETLMRPLLDRSGEPLDRMAEFDAMRMFYVALSRAQNLLVLAHYKGQGQVTNEAFKRVLATAGLQRVPDFDPASLPAATLDSDELPRNYSYTGDYLSYQTCPRQYMLFHKYGFVAGRSQTMMFGTLVHQTIDDLHQFLIAQRSQA